MGSKIKRKIRSEEGASLMLALLFFVICAMVASVILAAATAAAGRLSKLEKYDQNKYALESAAGVLKDELTEVKYIATWNLAEDGSKNTDPDRVDWEKNGDRLDEAEAPKFAGFLEELVKNKTLNDYTLSIGAELPDVIMKPSMVDTSDDEYSIKLELTVSGSSNSPKMTLTLPADKQTHQEERSGNKFEVLEIAWHTCVAVLNDNEYNT